MTTSEEVEQLIMSELAPAKVNLDEYVKKIAKMDKSHSFLSAK